MLTFEYDVGTVDGGEADHFIGQNSPPLTAGGPADSGTAQLFASSDNASSSFAVGFGAAPPVESSSMSQSFQTAPSLQSFAEPQTGLTSQQSGYQPASFYQQQNFGEYW